MAARRIWLLALPMALLALILPLGPAIAGPVSSYTLRVVALGGALLGALSGAVGCFAVLRRESLLGDALSHAALPGVALAFLLAGRQMGALLIGAGLSSWLGMRLVAAITRTTRLKQDAAMGLALVSFFAAGIALLTWIQSLPDASQAGLDSFIFGQAAAIVESDIQLMVAVGLGIVLALLLCWKECKLVTFDADFASVGGLRSGLVNALLSTLIVIAIVLGLQLAGVILMVGMLVAPAIAARQWTQSLGGMVALAAVLGAFAGGSGAIISALDSDIPTGPVIIVVAFALVVASLAFAPGRGIIWQRLRLRESRARYRNNSPEQAA